MKGLENLFKQTGRFLASSLTAAALYVSAQEPRKIEVEQDGSWKKISDVTLYFQSTTGSQGRDLTKSKANQYQNPVYFSGRRNSNGNIEFFYATTDWNKPSKNPAVPDNVHSKLYLIADSDTTAEIVSQKIAILNSKGEVTFEDATPKEKASSTLMNVGINLVEATDKGVRTYVKLKTAGIVNLGVEEALIDYCESQTKRGASDAKNNTGYELSVQNLPLWVRDNNFAFRNREVGRVTEIKIKSSQGDKIPISVYYSLALKRETEQERGTIDAFTELFTTPARKTETQNCTTDNSNRNSLEGLWTGRDLFGRETLTYISQEGLIFPLQRIEGKTPLLIADLDKGTVKIKQLSPTGKIEEMPSQSRIIKRAEDRIILDIQCEGFYLDKTRGELKRRENNQEILQDLENSSPVQKKQKEPPQTIKEQNAIPPKQTTGPSYDIRNWFKR